MRFLYICFLVFTSIEGSRGVPEKSTTTASAAAASSLSQRVVEERHLKPQAASTLTQEAPQTKIIGGKKADIGEYPFYVHATQGELCGGTLVAPDVVLTAAHCQAAFSGGSDDVIIGSMDVYARDSPERIEIVELVPHESYTPGPELNDIMLVLLASQSTAPLVRLNTDPDTPAVGDKVSTIGFGFTAEDGEISADLLEVDVNVVDYGTCDEQIPGYIIEPNHICASADGKDSCGGDSGGPLLDPTDKTQFGVITFGIGCARPDKSGVYTRVSAYYDWIKDYVCAKSAAPPDGFCRDAVVVTPQTPLPTSQPTRSPVTPPPTATPTKAPTKVPTASPTNTPTKAPTASPTKTPTASPTKPPTKAPTKAPTASPTATPTAAPTTTAPTASPTKLQPVADDATPSDAGSENVGPPPNDGTDPDDGGQDRDGGDGDDMSGTSARLGTVVMLAWTTIAAVVGGLWW